MSLLDDLARTRDETLGYFALDDAALALRYAPGKWTNRELLLHLADAEGVLFERVRRVVGEGRRVLWAFDQDGWARATPYDRYPLSLARDLYAATRAAALWFAGEHYQADGGLEFVHSETGVRTLAQELEKIAAHNEHHLVQLRSTLAAR